MFFLHKEYRVAFLINLDISWMPHLFHGIY